MNGFGAKYSTYLGIVSAAIILSACETTQSGQGTARDAIKVNNAEASAEPYKASDDIISAPEGLAKFDSQMPAAPAASVERYSPMDGDAYLAMATQSSDSVQIYDLDGPVQTASAAPSGGMVTSMDSSVTVFPVDGGNSYPGQMGASWPNSVLPVNMSAGYSGNLGDGASDGTASPRVGSGYSPSQIFFDHGSSRLGSGDKRVLKEVAEQAKFAPVDRVKVEGFASTRTAVSDPVESKIVNLKQSMNRAFKVSSELIRDGVPSEKIQTTVWGDSKTSPAKSEAEERRVDITTGAP